MRSGTIETSRRRFAANLSGTMMIMFCAMIVFSTVAMPVPYVPFDVFDLVQYTRMFLTEFGTLMLKFGQVEFAALVVLQIKHNLLIK